MRRVKVMGACDPHHHVAIKSQAHRANLARYGERNESKLGQVGEVRKNVWPRKIRVAVGHANIEAPGCKQSQANRGLQD